jgi:DNA-binding MarR family transcriptional regulator/ribosomal protein S18 acetylase RimI-like enzyme
MDDTEIRDIRDASRRLVRELGFMRPTLAGTNLHASAVHAIIEIGQGREITAADLANILNLEKSSISRMVRKLIDAGEVVEAVSDQDARSKLLSLTEQGRETLAKINAFARKQVCRAVGPLSPSVRKSISAGLATYARALEGQRSGSTLSSPGVSIRSGYQTGLVGRCVEMHARYYAEAAGFGTSFETQVASDMSEFMNRVDRAENGIWTANRAGEIVGIIVSDGGDLGHHAAHLRWFIVDETARAAGIGRRLLTEAVSFCDRQGFPEIELWTFAGLDAAKHLYGSFGFTVAEERRGTQWGTEVLEQRYVRKRSLSSTDITNQERTSSDQRLNSRRRIRLQRCT